MEILKYGSTGAQVQLLQLALSRAGFSPGNLDGIFGAGTQAAVRRFQSDNGLAVDGVVGRATHRALIPWYTGYFTHTLARGDTLYSVAMAYGTTLRALETANPGLDPFNLQPGAAIVVPLSFPVVPTTIAWCSSLVAYCVRGLAARYPFIQVGEIGRSVLRRSLYSLQIGAGDNRVLYNAAHHANEWITTPVLLKFLEDLCTAYIAGGQIAGVSAGEIFTAATLCLIPAVNPDGIDLVTGALSSSSAYTAAATLSANYPDIPFPSGWKANIRGTDLNLQYPAGWEIAREIKYAQGYTSPGPRDYVGTAPLSAPESRAMYTFTQQYSPNLTLSYHTQGEVIYWKYLDYEPPRSREIAQAFGQVSGYAVEETPYVSGHAGYKDWFIQDFNRPGYTIECGLGENPLPISDFDAIYQHNLGILTLGAILTA